MNLIAKWRDKFFERLFHYVVQWAYDYYFHGNRAFPAWLAPKREVLVKLVEEELFPAWQKGFKAAVAAEFRERVFLGVKDQRVIDAITSDLTEVMSKHIGGEWGEKDHQFIGAIAGAAYERAFSDKPFELRMKGVDGDGSKELLP